MASTPCVRRIQSVYYITPTIIIDPFNFKEHIMYTKAKPVYDCRKCNDQVGNHHIMLITKKQTIGVAAKVPVTDMCSCYSHYKGSCEHNSSHTTLQHNPE